MPSTAPRGLKLSLRITPISVGPAASHRHTGVSSRYFATPCGRIKYSIEMTRSKKKKKHNEFIVSYNFFAVKFNSKVVIGRDRIM